MFATMFNSVPVDQILVQASEKGWHFFIVGSLRFVLLYLIKNPPIKDTLEKCVCLFIPEPAGLNERLLGSFLDNKIIFFNPNSY